MFDKDFKVKSVRKYGQPAYPVIDEDGNLLFMPPQTKVSDITGKLTLPMVGAALVALASQNAQASTTRKPEKYITETSSADDTTEDNSLSGSDNLQETKPSNIKRFSEKDITSLLKELSLQIENNKPQHKLGRSSGPIYNVVVTEEQARRILEKFFRKNGISFEYDQPFKKPGIDFTVDAYNDKRKIGYEFGYTCEPDLTQEEIDKLQELSNKGKEQILLIDANKFKGLPSGRKAITQLQTTAEEFLKMLYNKGILKSERLDESEIAERIKLLGSAEEKVKAKAYEELKKCGISLVDKLRKEGKKDIIEKLIKEIEAEFQKSLDMYYKGLNNDDADVREKTTKDLINMDEDALPFVKKLLEMAKEKKSAEVEWRTKHIIKEVE